METVVLNFHDETGDKVKRKVITILCSHFCRQVGKFPLQAGDDAAAICWMEISSEIKLYASHRDFVKSVVEKHNAHW